VIVDPVDCTPLPLQYAQVLGKREADGWLARERDRLDRL
jgi:hypothetical protein